jgi:VanZ family protein
MMVLVFLLPVPPSPLTESNQFDKVVHFGIFLGFALLFYFDRRLSAGWTLLTSVAFAAGIELVQSVLPYRQGDWLDLIAGASGAGLGVLLVFLVERTKVA